MMLATRTTATAMLVLLASASASDPPCDPATEWCTCAHEHVDGGNICDTTEGSMCYFEGYATDILFGKDETYINATDLLAGEYACQHSGDCNTTYCSAGNCCQTDDPPPLFDTDPVPGTEKRCKCRKGRPLCEVAGTCGDPITTFQGQETRYWLSMEHFTPIFEQGPLALSQLAGPANPPPGLENHKGAWVMATELKIAGLDSILIETVDPTTLLAQPNATAPPAAGALTTMRLSFVGKQLKAGEHKLSVSDMTIAVSAKADPDQKIGRGFVEQIDIKAEGLHLRIMSSKASKFADESLQVLGLHLDVQFLSFEQDKVRGALPEMWGLQPMSKETKLLLEKPAGF